MIHYPNDIHANLFPSYVYKDVFATRIDNIGELPTLIYENKKIIFDSLNQTAMFHACRHANGRDWWVLPRKWSSNRYFSVYVSPDTIISTLQQANFPNIYDAINCKAKFSPDGNYYASYEEFSETNIAKVNIFQFDRCNGTLHFDRAIPLFYRPNSDLNSIEWSPDSKLLYFASDTIVEQYEIANNDRDTVAHIGNLIGEFGGVCDFAGDMQITSNGKIIIQHLDCNWYSRINNPNGKGANCEFQSII